MLSVQNYNLTANKNMAFKGKSEDTENKPFQTHAGLKTGIVAGAIGGGGALLEGHAAKTISERFKLGTQSKDMSNYIKSMMQEVVEFMNSAKKTAKIMAPAILAASIACGVAVDAVANKKHNKIANLKDSNDAKEILQEESRANTTRNGNVYYKSNIGKKLGTLLGAVVLPVATLATSKLMKYKTPAKAAAMTSGMAAACGALGGLVLGAITDKCSNHAARKAADKQAQEA